MKSKKQKATTNKSLQARRATPVHVEKIREEVKFIKRYVGLFEKEKSRNLILSFIKSLQRAIVQRLIRKSSPLAKEIEMIQDKLIRAYNSKKRGNITVPIDQKDLKRLVLIAGGEKVYPSINIIKRFIGLEGNQLEAEKKAKFIKTLESVLRNKKVSTDDPYYNRVKAILKAIRGVKSGSTVHIAQADLNGLAGLVDDDSVGVIFETRPRKPKKKVRKCIKGTYSDARFQGACSHNGGLSGILTAGQMATRVFDLLDFISLWSSLLGKPARNFTMMIHGEPGAGKTTFLLKFVKYLAENFGKVLYVSSEEFASVTLTQKINDLLSPSMPQQLHFTEGLGEVDLASYKFIVLDSVNDLGLNQEEFKRMRESHPDLAFILILQHTKDGQYRGGKGWEHGIEIAGQVEDGVITIYRNRYGVKGTMDFFNEDLVTREVTPQLLK